MLGTHEVLRDRQPALHHDRARQVHDADDKERIAPIQMVCDHPRDEPPAESAQHSSRNVRSHGAADIGAAELFADVGHDDHDHAGNEDALHETPEDELVQVLRGSGEHGRHSQGIKRGNDDALAADRLREQSDERRGERDGKDRGADGEADGDFRGVIKPLQIGKQRLGVINVEKGTHPGQHAGGDGDARGRAGILARG